MRNTIFIWFHVVQVIGVIMPVAVGGLYVNGHLHSSFYYFASPTFHARPTSHRRSRRLSPVFSSAAADGNICEHNETTDEPAPLITGVVAPLKNVGPYPCLRLCFPNLGQGVSLDFLLDTGANVNSIDTRRVQELGMPMVASSKDLPFVESVGVGGSSAPGDIYQLGDCCLDGLPADQSFTFMRNLTAASLPIATPVGDGLLGLGFMFSFPAGVEFDWHGTNGDPPTMIFYYGSTISKEVIKGMTQIPLERLAGQILSLKVYVNGVKFPALLDTGSPITVLNPQAAKEAGIDIVKETTLEHKKQKQTVGDNILMVGGVDGGRVELHRSASPVSVSAGQNVSMGEGYVYVGDLPGLALVGGLGDTAPPAVVLGLDYLRRTYRMILCVSENEVWFEELKPSA